MNKFNFPASIKTSVIGIALVLGGVGIGKNVDNTGLSYIKNSSQIKPMLVSHSDSNFKYLASNTPMSVDAQSEFDVLERQLTERFGRSVFLKNMKDTSLYLAVIDDQVLFVERTGRFVMKGELLDLNSDVIVSSIIRSELDTIQSMSAALNESKITAASDFLLGDLGNSQSHQPKETNNLRKASLMAESKVSIKQKSIDPAENTTFSNKVVQKSDTSKKPEPTKTTDITPIEPIIASSTVAATGGDFYDLSELPITFGSNTPVSPDILAQARELSPTMPTFADQCLSLALEADSFVELYSIFNAMGNPEIAKQCGGVLAGKYMPILEEENLVIYKADNEVGTVTLISDYTCPFCKRAHDEIPRYLEQGITVKVFPYGRESYVRKDGSPTTISNNMDIVMCEKSNERKIELMDELVSNPRLYNQTLLTNSTPVTAQCREQNYIYKVMGNVLTRGSTPMLVSSTGVVGHGYIPYSSFISESNLL